MASDVRGARAVRMALPGVGAVLRVCGWGIEKYRRHALVSASATTSRTAASYYVAAMS